MTRVHRPLLSGILAALLLVTGLGLSMARGAMASDGQLCSVSGSETLVLAHDGLPLLDGAGEPVLLDTTACLDCLLDAFAPAAPARVAEWPAHGAAPLTVTYISDWVIGSPVRIGQARAPPASA